MKVIVGIEDEVFGNAIVDFIGTQKWASGTEFKLIHVINVLATGEVIGEIAYQAASLQEEEKKAAEELLMELDLKLLKAVPDAQTEQKILFGSPKERLLDEIEEAKADLLIVGSHGRTGLTRFFLGSVSMALLSVAPCSVLIVKLPASKSTVEEPKVAASTAV